MYEFDKLQNENIVLISDKTVLKSDNSFNNISTIITNKRLLLLDFPNELNNYQEVMRVARGVDYIQKKEVILAVNLNEILRIEETDGYDRYILKNGNYFCLSDKEVRELVNSTISK